MADPVINANPRTMHALSSNHKNLLLDNVICGCFYCQEVYDVSEIEHWIADESCALCPHCGIDSVIPVAHLDTPKALLKEMYKIWFT